MPTYDGSPETVAESINHHIVSLTSVGAVYIEGTTPVPVNGLIHRMRAVVSAGTAISQVAVSIREATGASGLGEVYEWPLATQPLDSRGADSATTGAPLFYAVDMDTAIDQSRGKKGYLYIAAKVDDATADHAVTIQVDIEVVE